MRGWQEGKRLVGQKSNTILYSVSKQVHSNLTLWLEFRVTDTGPGLLL